MRSPPSSHYSHSVLVTHQYTQRVLSKTSSIDVMKYHIFHRCVTVSMEWQCYNVVIAVEHIGFDSLQKAYMESAIPDLAYMERVTWEQSREIKPHLGNIFESMVNQQFIPYKFEYVNVE
jgi:hypothetical protein